jgi:hypothetical protein
MDNFRRFEFDYSRSCATGCCNECVMCQATIKEGNVNDFRNGKLLFQLISPNELAKQDN